MYQSKDEFFRRLRLYFLKGSIGYSLIEKAYDETMCAFEDIKRDGGSPYFGHPEAVAIILLEHLRIRDPHVIAAAILHDNVEDLPHLGWNDEYIQFAYNKDIAELVWWVTKFDIVDFGGDKKKRNALYHVHLQSAPRRPIMIKLADRLHNIMTLWAHETEKQQRKIQETYDFYIPLAEEHTILIHELECAIREVEKSWNK
ncbi:bifunctional (p)ppGpp synthetase/guanosine-3',5'-bis(diphosphate) 3'-pyrophosphohydrolase [Candidatus Kaiserbacteria bacterium]|nr:MAG: bifunctional (p)ppGpp synthetase/guanosine-3',5'-bis(diphosphate) 3'-pyrophosphohydrolase [Candidatus Kaiserbacteria bacterium]